MTGYKSKRDMAEDKYFGDALTIAYQSGFYDGKKAAQKAQEPVAWMYQEYRDGWRDEIQFVQPPNDPIYFRNIVPVYDTPPPPAQEPVAYLCRLDEHGLFDLPTPDKACEDCFPVYTAPPQRPWVGLTQDEPMQIWDGIIKYAPSEMRIKDFAQAIEAKLKEKNNAA